MKRYEEELKQRIIRLHLEEGRTLNSLAKEYDVSTASISIWIRDYRAGCLTNQGDLKEHDYMQENRKLRKELEEQKKENLFLKKAAAFFAKEID